MQKQLLLVATVIGSVFVAPSFAGAQTATLVNTSVNITSYNAPNPRGAPYPNANVSLSLAAGTPYTIRTATTCSPNYSVDTYIYLLDPSGNVVGQDDDDFSDPISSAVTNNYGSYLLYTPTVSGSYTLVVSVYSSSYSYQNVPVVVTYPGTSNGGSSGGGPTTGTTNIPNVRLDPRPKFLDGLYAQLIAELSTVAANFAPAPVCSTMQIAFDAPQSRCWISAS